MDLATLLDATGSFLVLGARAGVPTKAPSRGSCAALLHYISTLPALGVTPARPVIGIVPTADTAGYWLIGSDGGTFSFGDAGFVGSLPGLGADVTDIVGAVPTRE